MVAKYPILLVFLVVLPGCIKSMAVNSLGDALAKGGGTYARDDDPELVREATAFGLKTMESLLDAEPEHVGLHLALARGFTQYAFAFLSSEADFIEASNYPKAAELRVRAKKMFVRARRYGLAGLSLQVEDFEARFLKDPARTLALLDEESEGLLYWTAASWAAAVGLDKDDAPLASGLDLVELLIKRAVALDPGYEAGGLHDFLLVWDAGRPPAAGGSVERARQHMAASLAASQGQRVAPLVSFAEQATTKLKNPAEFDALLQKALAFDVDSAPQYRLANLIAQKRARWLVSIKEDLFLE